MKPVTKTLIATALAVSAITAHAIPQAISNRQNMSMFLDTYGNVYIAGDCKYYAPCGPLSGAEYGSATYAEFQNAKYVYASPYANAIIDKNGGVHLSGDISSMNSTKRVWEQIAVPGEAVDAAWDKTLTLWMLVKTDVGTELFKYNLREKQVVKVGDRTNWLQIDADTGVVALDIYGNVYGWGNDASMYGNDAITKTSVPPTEPTVQGLRFKKITAGKNSVVGITPDNVPYAWGSGSAYSAGLTTASNIPTTIPGMPTVKDAVLTDISTMFIDAEGKLVVTGWTNLRTYMGQAMKKVGKLEYPYKDSSYSVPYTPTALANGSGAANFFIEAGMLQGWSSNQRGELAVGGGDPEYHYITRTTPFVGTPPMIAATELEPTTTTTKVKGNASYNNGKGGNYEKTGMVDNGKGEARNKVYKARTDGRGFKRSKS